MPTLEEFGLNSILVESMKRRAKEPIAFKYSIDEVGLMLECALVGGIVVSFAILNWGYFGRLGVVTNAAFILIGWVVFRFTVRNTMPVEAMAKQLHSWLGELFPYDFRRTGQFEAFLEKATRYNEALGSYRAWLAEEEKRGAQISDEVRRVHQEIRSRQIAESTSYRIHLTGFRSCVVRALCRISYEESPRPSAQAYPNAKSLLGKEILQAWDLPIGRSMAITRYSHCDVYFEVAGPDGRYNPASATLALEDIEFFCEDVQSAVASVAPSICEASDFSMNIPVRKGFHCTTLLYGRGRCLLRLRLRTRTQNYFVDVPVDEFLQKLHNVREIAEGLLQKMQPSLTPIEE